MNNNEPSNLNREIRAIDEEILALEELIQMQRRKADLLRKKSSLFEANSRKTSPDSSLTSPIDTQSSDISKGTNSPEIKESSVPTISPPPHNEKPFTPMEITTTKDEDKPTSETKPSLYTELKKQTSIALADSKNLLMSPVSSTQPQSL